MFYMSTTYPAIIYSKYRVGDRHTDEELQTGIKHFGDLASALFASGSEFAFAAREANRVLTTLEGYRDARKRERNNK